MSSHRVVLEQDFLVSEDKLWEAILDHEGMSRWLDARVSVLARRDGESVGTVRRIRARGLVVVDEEVVYADPPAEGRPGRLVYRVLRGAPLSFHRGEMIVERTGPGRSRLTWDVVMAGKVPGVARVIALGLEPVLRRGLFQLERQLRAA